jgi:predicted nucleic acid-binding protein
VSVRVYYAPKFYLVGESARLGDALIAQSCIDQEITLLTRDRDFRAFTETAGLDLL